MLECCFLIQEILLRKLIMPVSALEYFCLLGTSVLAWSALFNIGIFSVQHSALCTFSCKIRHILQTSAEIRCWCEIFVPNFEPRFNLLENAHLLNEGQNPTCKLSVISLLVRLPSIRFRWLLVTRFVIM